MPWRHLGTFAASTIARKRRDLDNRIGKILFAPSNCDCERALRPAVISRKVTNGFRSSWAAHADTAVRTVIDTERLAGVTPYHSIRNTIAT